MVISPAQALRLVVLAAANAMAPGRASSQIHMLPDPAHTVLYESDFPEGYILRTAAVGFPSLVVSAVNLTGVPAGGPGLGLLGIGLGVGHGILLSQGLREDEAQPFVVAMNGIFMVFSAVTGVRQIRSTIGSSSAGDLPNAVNDVQLDGGAARPFQASIAPTPDGIRLLLTWRPEP